MASLPSVSVAPIELRDDAWIDMDGVEQLTNQRARCRRVALCDESGRATFAFRQGDVAHVVYEFDALETLTVPSGGVELRDATGRVLFGKNCYQCGVELPGAVHPGTRLRFHQVVVMALATGEYDLVLGLASTDTDVYEAYRSQRLDHDGFGLRVREECRVMRAVHFSVLSRADGQLTHHGMADLPSQCEFQVAAPMPHRANPRRSERPSTPTVFHVTHWKAGSQWLHRILRECFDDRIVAPVVGNTQFLHWPLQAGKVYPTLYVTYREFLSTERPPRARHFVVVRDLRDTLVSAYFSVRYSHMMTDASLARWRADLSALDLDDGLIYLMDEWLAGCAKIQLSWAEAGERLIRFEDLLQRDVEILSATLIDDFGLALDRDRFTDLVVRNRFQVLSGRPPGCEDQHSHFRNGVVGDWRRYFSDRVKRSFKMRYGGHLIAAGYERDLDW